VLKEILEALNTKVNYKFIKENNNYNVNIIYKNEVIDINFINYLPEVIDNLYEITFSRNNEILTMDLHKNTFEILGIIKNIIIDFIKLYKPNAVFFSSSDNNSSRIKLYTRLANEVSKFNYKNYRIDRDIPNKDIATFLIYKNDNTLKELQYFYKNL